MICETSEIRRHRRSSGPKLLVVVAEAEDALARLDERLRASPIRDGFFARAHFSRRLRRASGSPASSSTWKTLFSTIPRWICARRPTN